MWEGTVHPGVRDGKLLQTGKQRGSRYSSSSYVSTPLPSSPPSPAQLLPSPLPHPTLCPSPPKPDTPSHPSLCPSPLKPYIHPTPPLLVPSPSPTKQPVPAARPCRRPWCSSRMGQGGPLHRLCTPCPGPVTCITHIMYAHICLSFEQLPGLHIKGGTLYSQ